MDRHEEIAESVKRLLGDTLGLGSRADAMSRDTRLLGSVPELDSMAVVSVLTALEARYGFVVADDELSAETFETVGSLTDFVEAKTAR